MNAELVIFVNRYVQIQLGATSVAAVLDTQSMVMGAMVSKCFIYVCN